MGYITKEQLRRRAIRKLIMATKKGHGRVTSTEKKIISKVVNKLDRDKLKRI